MFDTIFWIAVGAGIVFWATRREKPKIRASVVAARLGNLAYSDCLGCGHDFDTHLNAKKEVAVGKMPIGAPTADSAMLYCQCLRFR